MHKTAVLIVGAGPTGLMMACQLALQDIPFLLIEKEQGPTTESRALGIQARTLEVFRQMGISEKFITQGQPAKGLNFMAEGNVVRHIPFTGLGKGLTEFPFLLILEQSKTEGILVDFLKNHRKDILWGTTLSSFNQDKDKIHAVIQKDNGKEEEVEAKWIVGADGAHSKIRHTLGIHLKGKTYPQSLFVLDCKIDSNLSKEQITVATSKISFGAFFPMTGNRWRIVAEAPPSTQGKDTITFSDVEHAVPKRLNIPMKLSDPAWISLYKAHHRCASHFREGRAFLLGDAANIHSPIGAQGMNTGLQDAYNLAWKLAFVHHGKANEKLLDTYNEERLPFAKKLVETTDRLFNLFVSDNVFTIFMREHGMPLIMKFVVSHKWTGDIAFKTISQIGISYHTSHLSQNASFGDFPYRAPKPGDRLPYLFYEENGKRTNIQNVIDIHRWTLFVFSKDNKSTEELKSEIIKYKQQVTLIEIAPTKDTIKLFDQIGVKDFGYYLIRPDMYIAFRSVSENLVPFSNYLKRLFTTV